MRKFTKKIYKYIEKNMIIYKKKIGLQKKNQNL